MGDSLSLLDFTVVGLYIAFAIAIGARFSRRASTSYESFFVGDRKLPWWIAGTSIVATTFAADTPLAVTGITAMDGISGNWIWWCWAIAHLVSTFFFARLWRRSNVLTNAEITELRYSGRSAAGLRAFKAVYYGFFVNCLTMAWVIAAMVKISRAFFDVEPGWVIAGCVLVSVSYTVLGGYRSVVVTDMVQFGLGMLGALFLAILCVQSFGGVGELPDGDGAGGSGLLGELSQTVTEAGHRSVSDVLDFIPPPDHPTLPTLYFVVLLIAGWWQYAEGNGYIVQRLASCRDEGQAEAASLWFAVAHNALRPWPWILVALASLVVFPRLPGEAPAEVRAEVRSAPVTISPAALDLATGGHLEIAGLPADCDASLGGERLELERTSDGATARVGPIGETGVRPLTLACGGQTMGAADIRIELLDREMGYPLMMRKALPSGLLGLVVASLIAAFMSTIDTHTNWGSSYLVQDIYRRFVKPDASPPHYVFVSRICIVFMAAVAGVSALFISDIATVWRFLINLGAGLGSIAAVRWFWPRVTAWAEIAAMVTTTVLAISFEIIGGIPGWQKIAMIALASMATWIPISLFGPTNDPEALRRFARQVRPPGPAWAPYRDAPGDPVARMVQRFLAGLVIVFASLFGIGDLILGWPIRGVALLLFALFLLTRIASSGEAQSQSDGT